MLNSKSILIVDDEINVARTLQMVFEMDGYQVTAANSATEALQKFKDGLRVDIVLTDLNMEREDIGLDVARAAQGLKPRPLVVICTGYATVHNSSAALDMRVDYLATKPVDLDELKTAFARMLDQRSARNGRKRVVNG
jgi:two-component system chemotaxis response regulator CheY